MTGYKQGNLDYFCSLYAIVNAFEKITRSEGNSDFAEPIFTQLADKLFKEVSSFEKVQESGVRQTEMLTLLDCALRIVKKGKFGFSFQNKAIKKKKGSIDFLPNWRSRLNNGEPSALIALVKDKRSGSHGYYHWTVVSAIDDSYVHFSDSECLTKVEVKLCVQGRPGENQFGFRRAPILVSIA